MENLVSVIIPMYNAEDTIQDCLDSVVRQTYKKLEIIVVDDGSVDDSCSKVRKNKDRRIRLIQLEHNYIKTLNTAFSFCRGKYIARMDADDVMRLDRIKTQVKVFENYPEIDVCCSAMHTMGVHNEEEYGKSGIIYNLKIHLLNGNCLAHPTMMFKRELVEHSLLKYDSKYIYAEDFKLWTELALKKICFYYVAEPLVVYRRSIKQVSFVYQEEQCRNDEIIRDELFNALIYHMDNETKNAYKEIYTKMKFLKTKEIIEKQTFYMVWVNMIGRLNK